MSHRKGVLLFFFSAFVTSNALLGGCATKAEPAPAAGFVSPQMMTTAGDIPFHKEWKRPTVTFDKFTEIYIAPVNTEHLLQMDWWAEIGQNESGLKEVADLAEYTRATLEDAFRSDPNLRFLAVPQPGPFTLVIEFALIEVVPNKATLEALSYATGPAGRVVSMMARSLARKASVSTVAFEARLRDGGTGEIIAAYADREAEKESFINVKHFTWYGHAKSIIQEWAKQFVRVISRKEGEIIEDSKLYEFKPW